MNLQHDSSKDFQKELAPFFVIGVLWAIMGIAVSRHFSQGAETRGLAMKWVLFLWALCMTDLFSMGKAVSSVFRMMSAPPENRIPLLIQTSYWGLIKLACLGLFTFVLFNGRAIPTASLLAGLGTLVIVPIVGGIFWSKKELRPS